MLWALSSAANCAKGITATDLVLTVTQMLRQHGVVGRLLEFYGDGLDTYPLPTGRPSPIWRRVWRHLWLFPIDDVTLSYMRLSGRSEEQVALVEAHAKAQGMAPAWR